MSYFKDHGASYVWTHPLESTKALFGAEEKAYAEVASAVGSAVDSAANSIGEVVGSGVKGLVSPLLGDWWWLLLLAIAVVVILAIVL